MPPKPAAYSQRDVQRVARALAKAGREVVRAEVMADRVILHASDGAATEVQADDLTPMQRRRLRRGEG